MSGAAEARAALIRMTSEGEMGRERQAIKASHTHKYTHTRRLLVPFCLHTPIQPQPIRLQTSYISKRNIFRPPS